MSRRPVRNTGPRASAASVLTSPAPTASNPWASFGATLTGTRARTPGAAPARPPCGPSLRGRPTIPGTPRADFRPFAKSAGTSRSSPSTTWLKNPGCRSPSFFRSILRSSVGSDSIAIARSGRPLFGPDLGILPVRRFLERLQGEDVAGERGRKSMDAGGPDDHFCVWRRDLKKDFNRSEQRSPSTPFTTGIR